MSQFTIRAGRSIAAATLFGAFLSTVPLHETRAQSTDQPVQSTAVHAKHAKHMVEPSETRIQELHDKLHITAEQEALWGSVAQIMRDNAKTLTASVVERQSRMKDKSLTAVDDLKSFQVIADQHSDGLKLLIPAFEALYAGMTPDQQKHTDRVFGEHQRHAHMAHM
jgi:hypothetical protein